MWMSEVEMNVWMRGRAETRTASCARSMSGAWARARPAMTGPSTSAAMPADRLEVTRRGDREARFDDVDPEPRELVRDLELLPHVQRDAGRLLAVAQRGVEDDDPVVRALLSGAHVVPLCLALPRFLLPGFAASRPPRVIPPEGGGEGRGDAGATWTGRLPTRAGALQGGAAAGRQGAPAPGDMSIYAVVKDTVGASDVRAATTATEPSPDGADADIHLAEVSKRFGETLAVDRLDALDPARRLLRAARPLGLRQDDDAAHDRRLRGPHRRARVPRRRRRHRPPAVPPRRQHGLPVLRAVPAPRRRAQRRLRPRAPGACRRPRSARASPRRSSSSSSAASAGASPPSSPAASSSASRSRARS